jgi:hypothetical protein
MSMAIDKSRLHFIVTKFGFVKIPSVSFGGIPEPY